MTMTETDRKELLTTLEERVKALRTSEGWTEWLAVAKKFHNYSLSNQSLIAIQRPDATRVMGYGSKDKSTGWLSLGRQVRKGETGIKIFAPVIKKVEDETTGVKVRKLVAFKLVTVFDVSQTDGDPLPADPATRWQEALANDEDTERLVWLKVIETVMKLGYLVKYEDAEGSARGWIKPGERFVHVRRDTFGRMSKTTLHELAHQLDTDYATRSYAEGELVAESVAALAAHELGMDDTNVAETYIAGWLDGAPSEDAHVKLADTVLKIAKRISGAMFGEA